MFILKCAASQETQTTSLEGPEDRHAHLIVEVHFVYRFAELTVWDG